MVLYFQKIKYWDGLFIFTNYQKKKKEKKKRKSINANIALNLHTNKAKQKIAEASTVGFEPAQA